ncbi:MAG: 2-C-methyl-D-erythritol 2,4-cyclodiphosphate synthase [Candidatus Cloacimonadota bacterium]|nr:MAG: 2-C-methyl-D-erythritol 2,4-cyclodiphosphate synthase [Candidatus Cloacimonadota bacterium]
MLPFRIGQGYDVHVFCTGRPLILGGVQIKYDFGLQGHSDADVLIHAIVDALLGALALGDIGLHFPPEDSSIKGIDSQKILSYTCKLLEKNEYDISNIDCTIICEKPKLKPFILKIRENLAKIMNIELSQVSVKATTTEKLGFTGRKEGMAAQAIVLLSKK